MTWTVTSQWLATCSYLFLAYRLLPHGVCTVTLLALKLNERLNSDYYIKNVLEKIVKPAFARDLDDGNVTQRKLFQQDGARCHTSAKTTKWLDDNISSYIKPKDWPRNSPDLSPIENLWSILASSVYRDPEPGDVVQLKRRLQRAWRAVKVETLLTMISSMLERIRSVIKLKGNTVHF